MRAYPSRLILRPVLRLISGAVLAALAVGPSAAQTPASKPAQYVVSASEQPRPHRRHSRAAAPQRQIACTVVGCNPVPPGCHPEPQRYFSGMTTGFDAVVCP
jgi:hypothetical protein